MRIILFFSSFFLLNTAGAQECFPETRKDKKLVQKIERLIEKRAFYDAFDELRGKEKFAVLYELKAEILWIKETYFESETEALKVIDICPDNFPNHITF